MNKICVLVVDDEPIARLLITENLRQEGYEVVEADSGAAAWHQIDANPGRFASILLDRLMPDMDGIEILRRLKKRGDMADVPVILQTGLTDDGDISDGLKAGAYYYLTKPFAPATLLAIVNAATRDYRSRRELEARVGRQTSMLSCLVEGRFEFRSTDEALDLATLAANAAPEPARVVLGLSELMVNAIEHGNLGIGYQLKSRLLERGTFHDEIRRRQALPEFSARRAQLELQRSGHELSFVIRDTGNGFAWQDYLEISPERAFDTHGRGIAMSRMVSFDRLEYRGAGNEVYAAVDLP
jgi:DNA-binding response OmpR family regulator